MDFILAVLKTLYAYKNLILVLFFCINIFSFALYAFDKQMAQQGGRRIQEMYLLIVAAFFGAPGALFAMVFLRHKIHNPKFRATVPLLAIIYTGIVLVAISLKISGVYDIAN